MRASDGTGDGGAVEEPGAGARPPLRVLVVTGEASGDHHAAQLVRSLRDHDGAEVFGMGGRRCRAAGMDTVVDSEHSASVMGLTELLGSVRGLVRALNVLTEECDRRRPDAAVILDFPDFNLRLAKRLSARGIPVIYFVTPQVWAWRRSRVASIRRYITKAAPIFPFEESFLQQHGIDAEYVGHPFLDLPPLDVGREEFLSSIGIDPARPVVAILPGSRASELNRLLDPMLGALKRLQIIRPGLQGVLPIADTLDADELVRRAAGIPDLVLRKGIARQTLVYADAGMVASGTATFEAALSGLPCVVAYKLSPFTYRVARLLVRGVKNFAMANLIAGRHVFDELLQDAVTPEALSTGVERILGDPARARAIRQSLGQVRAKLLAGKPQGVTAAERVRQIVCEVTGRRTSSDAVDQFASVRQARLGGVR